MIVGGEERGGQYMKLGNNTHDMKLHDSKFIKNLGFITSKSNQFNTTNKKLILDIV